MNKILAIAFNTYMEARRNRVLLVFVFFALALMVVSGLASTLAIGEREKIMRDLGLAGINIFGLLVALFVGIGLVYNDIDRKTIYTIISKPIDRSHFVLGKFLGLLITIYVATLLMTVFFLAVLHFSYYNDLDLIWNWYSTKGIQEMTNKNLLQYYAIYGWQSLLDAFATLYLPFIDVAPYMNGLPMEEAIKQAPTVVPVFGGYEMAFNFPRIANTTQHLLSAILMSCMELMVITAFAVLFSVVSSPFLAFFFTSVMVIIGRLNLDIMRFADHLTRKIDFAELPTGGKIGVIFANLAALVSPNFTVFNLKYQVVYENSIPGANAMWAAAIYGLGYTAVVLSFAIFIFNRRSFK